MLNQVKSSLPEDGDRRNAAFIRYTHSLDYYISSYGKNEKAHFDVREKDLFEIIKTDLPVFESKGVNNLNSIDLVSVKKGFKCGLKIPLQTTLIKKILDGEIVFECAEGKKEVSLRQTQGIKVIYVGYAKKLNDFNFEGMVN
jgi:hypothetical protein